MNHIITPVIIKAAGNKPKEIREYIGRVNSQTSDLSIAHMISPEGWMEPAQTPDFDEYTLVLSGMLHIETLTESLDIEAGQAVIVKKGEWVRYSTPAKGGAQYIAVCMPAFSPENVHREQA
jgi:mannose-6-phosphate isomerase-like protein (cupin superfamily)